MKSTQLCTSLAALYEKLNSTVVFKVIFVIRKLNGFKCFTEVKKPSLFNNRPVEAISCYIHDISAVKILFKIMNILDYSIFQFFVICRIKIQLIACSARAIFLPFSLGQFVSPEGCQPQFSPTRKIRR